MLSSRVYSCILPESQWEGWSLSHGIVCSPAAHQSRLIQAGEVGMGAWKGHNKSRKAVGRGGSSGNGVQWILPPLSAPLSPFLSLH